MEEIDKRLRDATDACLAAHIEWAKSKKNSEARENLQEAVHELRKVAARLEIEMAVSERDEMASKPLPIPPHRSSKKRPGEYSDFGHDDDNSGNGNGDQGGGHPGQAQGSHESGIARTMRRRRPGGHQGGGGQPGFNNPGNHGGGNGNGNGPGGNGNAGGGGRPPE